MEKDRKIRAFLGLKQDEMAMLLQITRSQWSMFEIGKRDLPLVAQLKLGAMLGVLHQSEPNVAENFPHIKMQQLKVKKFFETQNFINTHRQLMVERKLKSIEKKYDDAMTVQHLIRFLATNEVLLYNEHQLLFDVIQHRAASDIQKNGLHIQAKQQLKWQLLQQEQLLIQTALRNLEETNK